MKTVVAILLFAVAVAASNVKSPRIFDPDASFLHCCKEHKISDSCQKLCAYDVAVHDVYESFTNKTCNIDHDLAPFLQCQYNFKDARKCCRRVTTTGKMDSERFQPICSPLCDGRSPVKFDTAFLKCPQVQATISECAFETRIRE